MTFVCPNCKTPTESETLPADRKIRCACGTVYGVDPSQAAGGKSTWIVVGTIVGIVGLVCSGAVVAAVAYPMWHKPHRIPECKVNLKSIYTAEKAYFGEKDVYLEDFARIGFSPEQGNRYALFISTSGTMHDMATGYIHSPDGGAITAAGVDTRKFPPVGFGDLPSPLPSGVTVGVSGTCPDCQFVAACIGNIDKDADLDIWSIASFDRKSPSGELISAGVPHVEKSDL